MTQTETLIYNRQLGENLRFLATISDPAKHGSIVVGIGVIFFPSLCPSPQDRPDRVTLPGTRAF